MTRLTGPKKKSKYANQKCEFCKRWFHNKNIHQYTATECMRIQRGFSKLD